MTQDYLKTITGVLLTLMATTPAMAAIALDRTRVVVNGGDAATTLNIRNESKTSPYLAQGWIENQAGEKIQSPLLVVPPLQRLEPDSRGQLKVQPLAAAKTSLPQDRETLFYFNLREIPPKSTKANTLQLALQTRVKLFYRPHGLAISAGKPAPQKQITLKTSGNDYIVVNPTPYYITLVGAGKNKSHSLSNFEPVMVAPKSEQSLKVGRAQLGNEPVLTYINDYGGRPKLIFSCSTQQCGVNGES